MTRRLREYAELQAIVRDRAPRIAMVLGSGLGDVAERLADVVELPFGSIAGMDATTVPGHRGVLLLGTWSGVAVLVFAGRLHYYEGLPWRTIVQPIHIAKELGASILLTTNAAGGIHPSINPGDIMAIVHHIDCTKPCWWRDLEEPHVSPYSPRLLSLLAHAKIKRGVYAQLTGPCYETPAEIRALCACLVDAVGMSTVREIETGHQLGMECAALSCITNKAAGLGDGPISHEEVMQMGRRLHVELIDVISHLVTSA